MSPEKYWGGEGEGVGEGRGREGAEGRVRREKGGKGAYSTKDFISELVCDCSCLHQIKQLNHSHIICQVEL